MPRIKNLLFDLGNVHYAIDFGLTTQAYRQLAAKYQYPAFDFWQELPVDLFFPYERGELTTPEFLEGLRLRFLPSAKHAELADAWNALLLGIHPGRVEGLARLQGRYPMALLSNTNELHFNYLEQEFRGSIADYFDHIFLSHHLGRRKPEVACFRAVLEQAGFRPEETLFVDDSAGHIAGAEAVGLHTLHLQELDQLFPLLDQRLRV